LFQNIFTYPVLRKTYFTVTVLLFTILGTILLGYFNLIFIDDSIYHIQLAIFALTSLSVLLLIVFVLPEIFPLFFRKAQKTKNFFLLSSLLVCLTLTKFGVYVFQYELSAFDGSFVAFFVLELIIIGSTLFLLRAKPISQGENIAQADDPKEFEIPKEQLTITGELLNENLTLSVDALLYIKSSDNYSEFYYTNQHGIQHKLMRMTLKSIEEQISYDYMVRNHKSYIVNMLQVKSITGNANNAKLHFKDYDLSLPVSRSKRDTVINILENLPL